MKEYQIGTIVPIEDTIIAYFDGRLNDSESAELLHRASVSPEIREIFQEHEEMRLIGYRAARNVAVSPELEESVFARVAALQGTEREKVVPVAFWNLPKISAVAGVAAIIALGLLAPWRTNDGIVSGNSSTTNPSYATENVRSASVSPDFGVSNQSAGILKSFSRKSSHEITESKVTSNDNIHLIADATPVASAPPQSENESAIRIIPQPAYSEQINMPPIGNPPATLQSLSRLPDRDNAPMFEIGLATDGMPSFNLPANVVSQTQLPFYQVATEMTVRLAFNFDARNQIGLSGTRVAFPDLSAVQAPNNLGYTLFTGSIESQVGYSGEIFYKHRMPVNDGLFYISGTIGGGFYTEGTLITGELGIEVPMSDKLMGGVSLIVSKLHQNGSEQEILSGNEPVIYDGPNVYNTLAGRIEYGLSYRF